MAIFNELIYGLETNMFLDDIIIGFGFKKTLDSGSIVFLIQTCTLNIRKIINFNCAIVSVFRSVGSLWFRFSHLWSVNPL